METKGKNTNKKFGTIFNNDINNILYAMDKNEATPERYLAALNGILDAGPGILAQNVGMPEAVIYRSDIENTFNKYLVEVTKITWPGDDATEAENEAGVLKSLMDQGKDPLKLTVEACRERNVKIVASYRMNAEDCYDNTWMLSDFGRAHPEYRIKDPDNEKSSYKHKKTPGNEGFFGCLDPAIPEVYDHRMMIFADVAKNYDIDGIEFDFRRWTKMISDPPVNHPILTQMVRDTRKMLDETAKAKGRDRMILGVRVGPSIETRGRIYDGGNTDNDISSIELGLDIRTWIKEEIADYICPSLFWPTWPGLPETAEFAELSKTKDIGVYPTLFPLPAWLSEEGTYKGPIKPDEKDKMQKYKDEFCRLALRLYDEGADGISTFNWYFHLAELGGKLWEDYRYGRGGLSIQKNILLKSSDPGELERYLKTVY